MKSISWTLSDSASIASVAQYVATLPAPNAPATLGGNATAGQGTFQLCMACHGAQAEGNEALHAPPLAGRSDWYLARQLQQFRQGHRGRHAQDFHGSQMARMGGVVAEGRPTENLIAYINALQ